MKFNRGSADKIERDLAALKRSQARLLARSDSAATALTSATAERDRVLIEEESDESPALTKAERSCRDAQDRHGAAVSALASVDLQIAEAEQALATERQRLERERVSTELTRRAAAIEVAVAALVKAFVPVERSYAEMLAAIRGFGLLIGDYHIPVVAEDHARAIVLAAIRKAAPGVLPGRPDGSVLGTPPDDAAAVGAELQVMRLRALAAQVLSGEVAAALPESPPLPFLKVTAPKTMLVLAESISWRDEVGHLVQANEGGCEIPEPVAAKAVELGIGHSLNSPQAVQILTALRTGTGAGANEQGKIVRRGPPWRSLGVNLYEWAEAERARRVAAAETEA